ncbi:hypothetical protein HYS72_03310 [Candidatus Pacearchaeota archaeon]|nr:hypothetical protein [Candidatus Pacearchaeota archaeon]MBI2056884.1 hypothetical protein [Candidatus Pacearchaeota archaeon]
MFNKLLSKFKTHSQIKEFNKDLVIGCNYYYRFRDKQDIETKLLADEIANHGLSPVLSCLRWPRDELFFYENGKYDYVQSGTIQPDFWEHEAYHGGRFLKGNDFIITSDAIDIKKREKTQELLNAKIAFYLPVGEMQKNLSEIKPNGKDIHSENGTHIDTIVGITNLNKTLFTYDHPKLIKMVLGVADKTNYNFKTIPLEEASYLAINFLELGDHIVIDKRAKKTQKIMKDLGYKIIKSPQPMENTNKGNGGIRCITTEIPKCYDKLLFYDKENKDKFQYFKRDENRAMFRNLKGNPLITFDKREEKFGPYLYKNKKESLNLTSQ